MADGLDLVPNRIVEVPAPRGTVRIESPLLGRPNTLGRDRLGIIASKRVGGAVDRNRAKRRVRALFRQEIAQRQSAADFDLVVIVRQELVRASFPAIAADFQAALRKLRGAR